MDEISVDRLFSDSMTGRMDPLTEFEHWFARAKEAEGFGAHAMSLATVDPSGVPDVRIVLLNSRDPRRLVFFTNSRSAKGLQIEANPNVAIAFHWKSLGRQVRMRGVTERVAPEETDAYFASRPRQSQISTLACDQSRPLQSRRLLVRRVAQVATRVGNGPIVRSPDWLGFRLLPASIEFWQDGEDRLHDRMQFVRTCQDADWVRARLYP